MNYRKQHIITNDIALFVFFQAGLHDPRQDCLFRQDTLAGGIALIINVEAQNDFYPGYPLIKRGIYYCCRMISSQYGREFTGPHYEKIKKVYSIWICIMIRARIAFSDRTRLQAAS